MHPDKTEKISIEYAPKFPYTRTNLYQNDFFITIGEQKSRVTILSSQPVYANEEKTNFEIMDEEFSSVMGYGKFNIEKIILHDLNEDKIFLSRLNSMLRGLSA
ncbi:hypothetical protein A3K82_00910 [Candidatus Pacearchaeota archaeon RBG_19FT_COMBO_34_9]|nr:MAG: hypothetical protein A3K82_00910 [Candidatus Pacearchaeota archaeon RBG_19FT_COMBO_34_9]OGJ16544.1 MAG: hypothetical protein A3K74_00365 [Candidatus Pacearchaeota archaeon RBG_13_33_26]